MALARLQRSSEALPHLVYAWAEGKDRTVALELARIHWQHGDFDDAARAYAALLDEPTGDLELCDYTAIAELAYWWRTGRIGS